MHRTALAALGSLILLAGVPFSGAHLTNPNGSWTSALLTGDACRYGSSLAENSGSCPLKTGSAAVSGTYLGASILRVFGDSTPLMFNPLMPLCPPDYCVDQVADCGLEVLGPGALDGTEPALGDALLNEPTVANDDSGNATGTWQTLVYKDGTFDDGGQGAACHTSTYGEDDYNSLGCSGTSHAEDALSGPNVVINTVCDDTTDATLANLCIPNALRHGGTGIQDCITGSGGTEDQSRCLALGTCMLGSFLHCGPDGVADFSNYGEGGGDIDESSRDDNSTPEATLHGLGTNEPNPPPDGQGVAYFKDTAHPECLNYSLAATYIAEAVELNVGSTVLNQANGLGGIINTGGHGEGTLPNADYTLAVGGWIDWTSDTNGGTFNITAEGGISIDACEFPVQAGEPDSLGDALNLVFATATQSPPCPET